MDIHVRLLWMQPNRMVKMTLPSAMENTECFGQVMFGRELMKANGQENVAQKWLALVGKQHALTVVNTGNYAHNFCDGELRITLLRSPAYCAHPIDDKQILPDDRYLPRIDIGERQFHFVIRTGERVQRLLDVDREAQIENEKPVALSFFPSGKGGKKECLMELDNKTILLTAFKKNEDGYVLRLYNPSDMLQSTKLIIQDYQIDAELNLNPFEVKTYQLRNGILEEISMDERTH